MHAFVVGEAKIVKKVIIWRDKIPACYIFVLVVAAYMRVHTT